MLPATCCLLIMQRSSRSCLCCDQSARQRILTECNAICSPAGRMHCILPANGTKRPSEHFSPRFRCILFTREKLTSCEKMRHEQRDQKESLAVHQQRQKMTGRPFILRVRSYVVATRIDAPFVHFSSTSFRGTEDTGKSRI